MTSKKNQDYESFTKMKKMSYSIFMVAVFFVFGVLFMNSCTKSVFYDESIGDPLKTDFAAIMPSNLADSVIVDPVISVTFKEGTDPQIISSSSITLKNGAVVIPGTVSVSGTTAQFTATGDLNDDCEYEATVFTKSNSGKYSTREYSWRFKTGRHHSYSSLKVLSVIPFTNATGFPVDSALTVTFNRELTQTMKNVTAVTLKKGTTVVGGTISFTGNSARFKPAAPLDAKTAYNGSVQIGPAMNGMNENLNKFTWSFTTAGDAADVTAPTVSSSVPANNATAVLVGANPTVTFSEAMNPSTVTSSTFTLKQGTTAVAGSVTITGSTATFKPSSPLTVNKVYTGSITTGAKDAAGNALATAYVWSFTTETGIDNTAPTILTVVPASGSTTSPTSTKATVTFSEAMNSATINSSSITLKQGTTNIAGTVTLSGAVATFTPGAALAANTQYTVSVTTAAKDAAGNALASIYTWSFTTAATADITAPTVLSVVPANNATAIAVSSKATVTFSEVMDAATISSSTFTLKQGSSAVSGVVTYSGTTATFTPSAALAASTVYTGTVTTGAKDPSGNAIASNYTWSFTTAALSDITAPTVVTVVPANNGTGIAANTKATATFSEAMNSTTITSSTFTLKQGNTTVAGSVTYSGTTVTFTPSAALAGSTVYTATITTGVKDVAGNALTSAYTWSFTTVAVASGKSFATDVMPILGICNTCHNHKWTASSNASTFYTNLVNGGYVNSSTPTSGKIYSKLNGGHPGSTVTTTQVNTILTWITEGSKNN